MPFVEYLPDTVYIGPGTESHADFEVQQLGESRYDSPALERFTDGKSAFIEDAERVLVDPRTKSIEECNTRGQTPPSMEIAGPRRKIFFNPRQTRAAIVTCGGLCPGINDVVRGIVLGLHHYYGVNEILGIRFGYQGLKSGDDIVGPVALTPHDVKSIHREGGTLLGTSRGGLSPQEAVQFLNANGIDILFTIGGDGTQKGAAAIAAEVSRQNLSIGVVGIPKTIDNDIAYVDRTFGFETAVSRARDVLYGAHQEACAAENGIGLVKLMGRHAGFIAARAALASGDANFILIPELEFNLEGENGLLAALESRLRERGHALIVVAEGAGQSLLQEAGAKSGEKDASGNVKLGDIGPFLRNAICKHLEALGMRHTLKYIDPSYYIRSMPADATDSIFCLRLAHDAVHAAMAGKTEVLVGWWNNFFTHVPLLTAATRRKELNPEGALWRAVLEASGQQLGN